VGSRLPPGLAVSSSGMLSGTPTSAGTYSVTIEAIDDSMPVQVADRQIDMAVN
jgi:hypothetical protein